MEIIALDCHKHYSFASVQTLDGKSLWDGRIEHKPGNIRIFLSQYSRGSAVAIETIGNWYWIVDEIEAAGMVPKLVHARKAKLMLGSVNKTDKLDALGLNKLQRAGTLPTVWIPPGDLRDRRELPRTRMVFAVARTRLKNRIHSVLAKYGLQDQMDDVSDIFGKQALKKVWKLLKQLPAQAQYTTILLLEQLDRVEVVVEDIERRMAEVFEPTEVFKLLDSLPGVGLILAVVISQEVGDIKRFSGPEQLASYAGTVPRVHASGGKIRYGRLRPDVNHYLKWAFCEAANVVATHQRSHPQRHVNKLYSRVRARRGHPAAVGAVARHLAEATYWMLTKEQAYRERAVVDRPQVEVLSKQA